MERLEAAIETRTAELIAQATGEPVRPSILVPTPGESAVLETQPA
jgi:1-acyl-sn-glycerol-3-phosphate acyltransferase